MHEETINSSRIALRRRNCTLSREELKKSVMDEKNRGRGRRECRWRRRMRRGKERCEV